MKKTLAEELRSYANILTESQLNERAGYMDSADALGMFLGAVYGPSSPSNEAMKGIKLCTAEGHYDIGSGQVTVLDPDRREIGYLEFEPLPDAHINEVSIGNWAGEDIACDNEFVPLNTDSEGVRAAERVFRSIAQGKNA